MYKGTSKFRQSPGRVIQGRRRGGGNLSMYDTITVIKRKPETQKEETHKRLYIVRFDLRDGPLTFTKIGISGTDISTRFQQDLRRYNLTILGTSAKMTESDALAIEGAFHTIFFKYRFKPLVTLASGNNECYQFPENILAQAIKMVADQKDRLVPETPQASIIKSRRNQFGRFIKEKRKRNRSAPTP